MKIKNKFFIICISFLLFLFITLGINNIALGFSGDNGYLTYSLPEFKDIVDVYSDEYFIMYCPDKSVFRLAVSRSTLSDSSFPFYFYYNDGNGTMQLRSNHALNGSIYECSNNANSWSLCKDFETSSERVILYDYPYWDNDWLHFSEEEARKYIITLNCDVYFDDYTGKKLVFQKPVTEIPETTIPALETVEQIPTAMVETLKLIIPVGLVIFGIVLLISLIKSVISRMT